MFRTIASAGLVILALLTLSGCGPSASTIESTPDEDPAIMDDTVGEPSLN